MNFSGADGTTATGILTTANTLGPWKGSRFANTKFYPHTLHQYRETGQMKGLGNIS